MEEKQTDLELEVEEKIKEEKEEIRIAVTPRHLKPFRNDEFYAVATHYIKYFKKAGYDLYLIPFIEDFNFNKFIEDLNIKALLLTGGYKNYTSEIKKFEEKIICVALKKKIPIIGICCGMWSINGYFGGKLGWNEKHGRRNGKYLFNYTFNKLIRKNYVQTHKIRIIELFKPRETIVNSTHRKVIKSLGEGLTPFIYSDDQEIEGFYNLNKKILAIQFHLRMYNYDTQLEKDIRKLIKNFIKF